MENVHCYPSINVATEKSSLVVSKSSKARVIIQEKVDGSQLTVCKQNGQIRMFNKNKEISGKSNAFFSSYVSLISRPELIKEGYMYHGEAMRSRKPNILLYDREPKYHWILYEVVASEDKRSLVPEEIHQLIDGTGIEYLDPLWDSKNVVEDNSEEKMDYLAIARKYLHEIESKNIQSHLGGTPEGVVLKALNRELDDGRAVTTRYKFVREEFSEMTHSSREKLATLTDEEFITEVGNMYNVSARFQKAKQHLQEQDKWNEKKFGANMSALVDELDSDLLKEATEDIKDMLFVRFFPKISRAARADLASFARDSQKQKEES